MGQITEATIKMIRAHEGPGLPPLTLWEVQQLSFAWERLQRAGASPATVAQPMAIAWVHESDPRSVISASQKKQALRDGGASASSVKPYSVAAYAQPCPSQGCGGAVTEAMIDAYLEANDAYWKRTDELPKSGVKWRNGTPREATREGLVAALSTAKSFEHGATDGGSDHG